MRGAVTRVAREPNAVLGLVTAGVNLAVIFGWDLTALQIAAVNTVFGALMVLVRQLVVPAAEVVAQQKPDDVTRAGKAAETGPGAVPVGSPVELVTDQRPTPGS